MKNLLPIASRVAARVSADMGSHSLVQYESQGETLSYLIPDFVIGDDRDILESAHGGRLSDEMTASAVAWVDRKLADDWNEYQVEEVPAGTKLTATYDVSD